MKNFNIILILVTLVSICYSQSECIKWNPGHYATPNKKYPDSVYTVFDSYFKGLQVKYLWRDLEIEKDVYDFSLVDSLLNLVSAYNFQLFVQVQERIFNSTERPIPDYLYEDPIYHGGVEPWKDKLGSVARLWDPAVIERMNILIDTLGKRYDKNPYFEGIIFPESAISIDRESAPGFSWEAYLEGLKSRLMTAKQAFPHSVIIQYVNWGPKDFLDSLISFSYSIGAGMGGPDLVPDSGRYPEKSRVPAYDFYPLYAGKMPLGTAVQSSNLTTKKGIFTLDGFWDMGINTLKLNYIFWAMVEGSRYTHSFSHDIFPYINEREGKINSGCPENIYPCCDTSATSVTIHKNTFTQPKSFEVFIKIECDRVDFTIFNPNNPNDFYLTVFNIKGRKVWTFALNAAMKGYHRITWNANDQKVANGLYIAAVKSNHQQISRKFIIVR